MSWLLDKSCRTSGAIRVRTFVFRVVLFFFFWRVPTRAGTKVDMGCVGGGRRSANGCWRWRGRRQYGSACADRVAVAICLAGAGGVGARWEQRHLNEEINRMTGDLLTPRRPLQMARDIARCSTNPRWASSRRFYLTLNFYFISATEYYLQTFFYVCIARVFQCVLFENLLFVSF